MLHTDAECILTFTDNQISGVETQELCNITTNVINNEITIIGSNAFAESKIVVANFTAFPNLTIRVFNINYRPWECYKS